MKTEGDKPAGQHILIHQGTARKTDNHIREFLLCTNCENRFSVAENVTSKLVWQVDDTFPWLSKLGPTIGENVFDSSAIDVSSVAYFAASIIWRTTMSHGYLGPGLGKYEVAFRQYLLDKSPFPKQACLLVGLMTDPANPALPPADRVVTLPKTWRANGHHVHEFAICGVFFHLLVGAQLPRGNRSCFSRAQHVYMAPADVLMTKIARVVGSSTRAPRNLSSLRNSR
jgi:hypothetical protein